MLNSNEQCTYIFFSNLDYFYGPYLICKCTHTCINSSHFPFHFIWNNSQLFCLVNKNVGTCRKASQWKYVCACVYVCVHFFSETTGPMKPKFMWNHDRMGEERIQMIQVVCCSSLAHLSRRLIGELIVYTGIRRPSVVRPSVVRQHFQTTSPLKPSGGFFPYYTYSIYR